MADWFAAPLLLTDGGEVSPLRLLLGRTLAEEKQTDEKLADLAKQINSEANEEGSEEQQDSPRPGKKTQKHAA